MVEYLEGYSSSKELSKDVCWAMAIAPSCRNVSVSEFEGFGWHVECECDDKEVAMGQIHSMLKDRYFNVNWL